jgi:hypothetical protein
VAAIAVTLKWPYVPFLRTIYLVENLLMSWKLVAGTCLIETGKDQSRGKSSPIQLGQKGVLWRGDPSVAVKIERVQTPRVSQEPDTAKNPGVMVQKSSKHA